MTKNKIEKAAFGAGCFWGVEFKFSEVKGVLKTEVGYMGGKMENPTYEDVCSDETGHAEAVYVEYEPSIVAYEKLLELFFSIHDPTTENRQGPDVGSQYRSAIFYYTDEQKNLAVKAKDKLEKSGKYKKPIVTEIVKAPKFYPAEEYHQKYFQKNGGTCHI